MAVRTSDHISLTLPYASVVSAQDSVAINASRSSIRIDAGNDKHSFDNSYVTIQYTKITDSAVSIGTDTDYSTTEKIVGTWIDGKPLYQKTVSGTFPDTTAGTYNAKNIATILNIDNVISICGWFKASNNTSYGSLPWITATGYIFKATFEKSDNGLYLQTNASGASTVVAYVTLQYTKTTD